MGIHSLKGGWFRVGSPRRWGGLGGVRWWIRFKGKGNGGGGGEEWGGMGVHLDVLRAREEVERLSLGGRNDVVEGEGDVAAEVKKNEFKVLDNKTATRMYRCSMPASLQVYRDPSLQIQSSDDFRY